MQVSSLNSRLCVLRGDISGGGDVVMIQVIAFFKFLWRDLRILRGESLLQKIPGE